VEDQTREEGLDEAAWEVKEQGREAIVSVPPAVTVSLTRGEPPVIRCYVPSVEKI
jgi:hypothetical protein